MRTRFKACYMLAVASVACLRVQQRVARLHSMDCVALHRASACADRNCNAYLPFACIVWLLEAVNCLLAHLRNRWAHSILSRLGPSLGLAKHHGLLLQYS